MHTRTYYDIAYNIIILYKKGSRDGWAAATGVFHKFESGDKSSTQKIVQAQCSVLYPKKVKILMKTGLLKTIMNNAECT